MTTSNTQNRRAFLGTAAVATASVATLSTPATASTDVIVPPTVTSTAQVSDAPVGALFWHDKKLFVKLSATEFDQVYPAIATYA